MRHYRQAAIIHAELARLDNRGRGKAYPEHIRLLAVAYFQSRRDAGATIAEIGTELGLPWRTLYAWATRERAPDLATAGFSPVEILDAPVARATARFTVEHHSGLRIEGLDLDSLAELLRRLA